MWLPLSEIINFRLIRMSWNTCYPLQNSTSGIETIFWFSLEDLILSHTGELLLKFSTLINVTTSRKGHECQRYLLADWRVNNMYRCMYVKLYIYVPLIRAAAPDVAFAIDLTSLIRRTVLLYCSTHTVDTILYLWVLILLYSSCQS
jgi:hypothetical protein